MKVIDLINKKYNDEEMPKHIKINRLNYIYDDNRKTYESEYGECMSFDFTNNVLNMQVELIEDEIDIQSIEKIDLFDNGGAYKDIQLIISSFDLNFTEISETINKLISSVKQLDKKIKEDKQ